MLEQMFSGTGEQIGMLMLTTLLFLLIAVWSIVWKGFALWVSAKEGQKVWFIVLLVFNTFGILEIIYLFVVSKKGQVYFVDWKQKREVKKKQKSEKTLKDTPDLTKVKTEETSEDVIINDMPEKKPDSDTNEQLK